MASQFDVKAVLSREDYLLPRSEWQIRLREISSGLTTHQVKRIKLERRRVLQCKYQQRARKKRIAAVQELRSEVKTLVLQLEAAARANPSSPRSDNHKRPTAEARDIIRAAVVEALDACPSNYDASDFGFCLGNALHGAEPGSPASALYKAVCAIDGEKEKKFSVDVRYWIGAVLMRECKDKEAVQWAEEAAEEYISRPPSKRMRRA